jgi:hypothetical protein
MNDDSNNEIGSVLIGIGLLFDIDDDDDDDDDEINEDDRIEQGCADLSTVEGHILDEHQSHCSISVINSI